jgi:hypothetical protein
MLGLNCKRLFFKEAVFLTPTELFLCPICRCKLVTSTISESNKPIFPTPAPAKYIAKGQPIPPAPIMAILFYTIFNCPSYAISLRSICRQYL